MPSIAIVGMACRYPDARTPRELWENVLAQRRAFRRMPSERMSMDDYFCADRTAPDCTYSREAAVIEGYEFDRVRFRVTGEAYRSADPAHWLALDIASQALADAGFADGAGLPRETTGVILANTLTGDASRAGLMRLRWPYVRRVVASALAAKDWATNAIDDFLADLEEMYKAPFAPIGEESLAGGLSNTIAGRICNHFDLKGCGYTVDGACASSLLAVSGACTSLESGDLDVALAGGVDLSLDPFELVGFAKAGALAEKEMRVYDARSQGFWPGEGCGFIVLMRESDARAQNRRIYGLVRGWGISSDGSGGITRPEADGQLLAINRAYRKAGFGIETIGYFEGHGTGTSVGDTTELTVLSTARRAAANPAVASAVSADGVHDDAPPAAIGSIKANIGHTKAAAGLAGFIKATMAVHERVVPPTSGCHEPHSILTADVPALRVPLQAEPWAAASPARAAISAMGFGGVNTHVVIEDARDHVDPRQAAPIENPGVQDAELFLFADQTRELLAAQIRRVHEYAHRLSRAELTDLAAELQKTPAGGRFRASVVASTPDELSQRLARLLDHLGQDTAKLINPEEGIFFADSSKPPRIGFVFPGQGCPANRDGGLWRRRFDRVADLYRDAALPADGDDVATHIAQPAIITATLAALSVFADLGIEADAAIGHSLGELAALHWAGAIDRDSLLRIAKVRGRSMAELPGPTGQMLAISAGPVDVDSVISGTAVRIAAFNTPALTVVSGEASAIAAVAKRAASRGLKTTPLRVSHAFHSPLVAPASVALARHLACEDLRPIARTVYSTVTGLRLVADQDLRDLLVRQVTSPVRFVEAATLLAAQSDLLIEVGPGSVMQSLLSNFTDIPVISLDAGGQSVAGLLSAVAAAFALGAPVRHETLFAGRFSRPFDVDWNPRFFANPCEAAPVLPGCAESASTKAAPTSQPQAPEGGTPLDVLRHLVAQRAELPVDSIREDSRLLGDLHLNSIMVGQVVAEAARHLGLPPPVAPMEFASATVGAVAKALDELQRTGATRQDRERVPAGVDTWFRAMTVEWIERPLSSRPAPVIRGRPNDWRVFAPPRMPLAESLKARLAKAAAAGGVMVVISSDMGEDAVELLLAAGKEALSQRDAARFVLVQEERGAEPFARTLHLEAPHLATRVVTLPFDHPSATDWVMAEIADAAPFREVRYDAAGRRTEPVLRPLPKAAQSVTALGSDDVLLVTGGGKGIAAECALSLAKESGAALVLLGRSRPDHDAELAENLRRFDAAGVRFLYISADVCDAVAIADAVAQARSQLGDITAFMHGAGTNEPKLIEALTHEDFRRTYCTKVQGCRNVLSALDPAKLRQLITFGSIIARSGLRGEADYAVANDWLARLTETWQRNHAHCRCLCLEWSVWSGVGMGQRLGRVELLAQQGITPIPPDEGVRLLSQLLARQLPSARILVTGRFGALPTLAFEDAQTPFVRFLEQPRVFYPGIEIVADAEVSIQSDPYLADHVFRGERLFPAVIGLEAMAQAVSALTGQDEAPLFESVEFLRPVAAPAEGALRVRIAALSREDGRIDVALRSESTDFAIDHFRASCRFWSDDTPPPRRDIKPPATMNTLQPEFDVYDRLLFHTGRFRRIREYRVLHARECLAELTDAATTTWFDRVLPDSLLLGDPAARDAAIHAIQACIPHATILPTGVERIRFFGPTDSQRRFVHAVERSHDGPNFVYDVEMHSADGVVLERWDGLHLRTIEAAKQQDHWPIGLLGPFIERRLGELIPHFAPRVEARSQNGRRPSKSDETILAAIGGNGPTHRRPDGKPEAPRGRSVSASHSGMLTLAIAADQVVGCDVEIITPRPNDVWADLLGPNRLALARRLAAETREDEHAAATRVWTLLESLKKAGLPHDAPLTLDDSAGDGWVRLRSGRHMAASYVSSVQGHAERLAMAVLVRDGDALDR